ncbi:MAG: hypothetical protein ABFS17_05020 [Chloroflexota bacterium]
MENVQMKAMGEEDQGKSALPLIILAVMALLFIYLVGQKTQISCTRASASEADCLIQSVWMNRVTVRSREALGVRDAYLDSSYDRDDDSTTYRVVLTAKDGDVPVTIAYSSGNIKKSALASDITEFIKYSTASEIDFSYKSTGGIITAIVVGVFFVFYALIVFKGRSS